MIKIASNYIKPFLKEEQLIYKIFVQTPEGQELLKLWTDRILLTPLQGTDKDHNLWGYLTGQRAFIQDLHRVIKRIETNQEQSHE